MSEELSTDTAGNLFMTLLQHMKCIEVRLAYAKCHLSSKQRLTIQQSIQKVKVAIDHICNLLPNSDAIMSVKKELDKSNLVYVMLLTEQLIALDDNELEEVVELIDNHLMSKDATAKTNQV